MFSTIAITVFSTALRVSGASRINVYASSEQALWWAPKPDGGGPIATTESNFTEWRATLYVECGGSILIPPGVSRVEAHAECYAADGSLPVDWYTPAVLIWGGPGDYNGDGDVGTDKDIEDFFACVAGNCCPVCTADFNHDGDSGTDADIEAFFAALRGSRS